MSGKQKDIERIRVRASEAHTIDVTNPDHAIVVFGIQQDGQDGFACHAQGTGEDLWLMTRMVLVYMLANGVTEAQLSELVLEVVLQGPELLAGIRLLP